MNGQFKRNQRKDKNNVFITKKDKPDFFRGQYNSQKS